MKLLNENGKYLTAVDEDIKVKSKLNNKNQSFKYTVQGDLIVDGLCVTNNGKNLNLDSCTGEEHQNWVLTNTGKIKSEEYCLTADSSDNVSLKVCDSSDGQEWDIEEDNDSRSSSYTWDKFKGKTVVLVEAENPWYVNKDITIQKKYNKEPQILQDLHYRPNADFESTFIFDPKSHSLGRGYSYANHLGVPCDNEKCENFENSSSSTNFMFYLCVILIALLLYRYFR